MAQADSRDTQIAEQFKRIKDAVWQLLGIASDRPWQAQRKASAPRQEAARSDSNHKEEER